MDPLALKKLNAARRERRAAVLVTDLGDGRDRVVRGGRPGRRRARRGDRQGDCAPALPVRSRRKGGIFSSTCTCRSRKLIAIGAVHISQALAPMAKIAGFDMEIIDPRTAFATQDRFPDVPLHAEWPEDVLKRGRSTATRRSPR